MFAQCVEQCRSIIQCEMNDVFVDLEGNLGFRLQYSHSLNGRAKEVADGAEFHDPGQKQFRSRKFHEAQAALKPFQWLRSTSLAESG